MSGDISGWRVFCMFLSLTDSVGGVWSLHQSAATSVPPRLECGSTTRVTTPSPPTSTLSPTTCWGLPSAQVKLQTMVSIYLPQGWCLSCVVTYWGISSLKSSRSLFQTMIDWWLLQLFCQSWGEQNYLVKVELFCQSWGEHNYSVRVEVNRIIGNFQFKHSEFYKEPVWHAGHALMCQDLDGLVVTWWMVRFECVRTQMNWVLTWNDLDC